MAQTFNFVPSKGFTKTVKPRVLVAQFGDGYSQRIQNGINNITEEWSLSFNSRSIEDADSMLTFFEEHAGAIGFYWTPPGESTAKAVICPEWSKSYDSHISATIQARFVKIFETL